MAITFPNAVKAVGANTTTVTTSGVTTTTGSTFVVVASYGITYAGSANTPTDNKGNTYTLIDVQDGPFEGIRAWRCENGAGGAGHTVTVTFPGDDYPTVLFLELGGAATASYDSTSLASETDTGPFSITSGALAQADSAVIAWIAGDGGGGTENYATSGYTVLRETDGVNYFTAALGYKTVASTSANTATWTGISAGNAALGIVAFKAAAAGGGVNVQPANAALTIAGQTPTLARTANQSVTPAADAVAITGPAPTLAQTAHQSVSPAADSVAITGLAPTIQQTNGLTVSPAADAIVLTGFAPTLAQTANQAVTPGADTLVLTGFAPSIVQASASVVLTPGAAVFDVTEYVPSLLQTGTNPYPPGGGDDGHDRRRSERLKKKRRKEAQEARAWLLEQDRITESLRPKKPRTVALLDLPRLVFDMPAPKAETAPKPSPRVAAVAKAAQARRQAESESVQVKAERERVEREAEAQRVEQERQERARQELRARNRRKAMQYAAQFFFQ